MEGGHIKVTVEGVTPKSQWRGSHESRSGGGHTKVTLEGSEQSNSGGGHIKVTVDGGGHTKLTVEGVTS